MKKFFILSLVFAAFLSSSIPVGSHSLVNGEEAPSITLSSKAGSGSLNELEGKYVVVNFWSASDPQSRITNQNLSKLAEALPSSKVRFVSICTDSDESLASQIMKADGINPAVVSLSSSDVTAQVIDDYQTATGLRSFLIDPFGNLVSVSPSEEAIKTIIS